MGVADGVHRAGDRGQVAGEERRGQVDQVDAVGAQGLHLVEAQQARAHPQPARRAAACAQGVEARAAEREDDEGVVGMVHRADSLSWARGGAPAEGSAGGPRPVRDRRPGPRAARAQPAGSSMRAKRGWRTPSRSTSPVNIAYGRTHSPRSP